MKRPQLILVCGFVMLAGTWMGLRALDSPGHERPKPEDPRVRQGGAYSVSMAYQRPAGAVEARELDQVPVVTSKTPAAYPAELKGSGIVGRVWVRAFLRPGGSVLMIWLSSASDRRFVGTAELALREWTFSVPEKMNQPVTASVMCEIYISEVGNGGPYVVLR